MTTEPISLTESKKLVALEKTIEGGRQTFVEVGVALAEIRDNKLYRADYSTFEEYCRDKWGWTKQHVYRLIECAPVAQSNPQVTSVNQARELAKVEPAKRVEVLNKAAKSGKVTAKSIKEAAKPVVEIPPVDPVKLETDKWKEALGGVELPEEKTALQNAITDLQYVVTEALANLKAANLPAFKLELEVQARRVKEQINK